MAATLQLNPQTWDLTLDEAGNIAVLADPDSLAQDAASAIKTFLGECYWDTTVGVNYAAILGQSPPTIALLKAAFVDAALTVPGVAAAQVFISSLSDRTVSGQVQVVSSSTGQVSAANFATNLARVVNPAAPLILVSESGDPLSSEGGEILTSG